MGRDQISKIETFRWNSPAVPATGTDHHTSGSTCAESSKAPGKAYVVGHGGPFRAGSTLAIGD